MPGGGATPEDSAGAAPDAGAPPTTSNGEATASPQSRPTVAVVVGQVRLVAEVAATPTARSVGLSRREVVPAGTGMVFVYPAPTVGAFWMRETWVPLSILWARDGRVLDVAEMPPCPGDPCPRYAPRPDAADATPLTPGAASEPLAEPATVAFDLAVEARAGTFTAAGVRPGDVVELLDVRTGEPAILRPS
jgi:hypothetical protein